MRGWSARGASAWWMVVVDSLREHDDREPAEALPAECKVSALVPYFGAKRTLAPEIVAELGPHDNYFEPFCGSCAVLLAKPVARMEYVNDLNGDMVNLIRVIQHEEFGPRLYRAARRALMSEALFREACARWKAMGRTPAAEEVGEACMSRALDYFFTSWVGRNGVTGTDSFNQGFAARFTGRGGHAGTRWISSVDSIPAWRRRLRGVVVLARDGIELADRVEDEAGTVIYCDPPYLAKGASYIHDFESEDHARLAAVLAKKRRARVVVSYYAHPRLEELYPVSQWTHRAVYTNKSLMSGNCRAGDPSGAVTAPEVLVMNGPSMVESSLF